MSGLATPVDFDIVDNDGVEKNISKNIYCVYEHWRPDKNLPFYVGKGNPKRARTTDRGKNAYHTNIVKKLKRLGLEVEIKIVSDEMHEKDAFTLEVERIAHWRAVGIKLANLSDGGEGPSGLRHTEEWKRAQSERLRGRPRSKEACEKTALKLRGIPLSEEHRKKLSDSHKGQIISDEARKKLSIALRGRIFSEDHRRKISLSLLGKSVGRKASEETKKKMSIAQTGRIMSPEVKEKIMATKKKNGKRWTLPTKRVSVVCETNEMVFSALTDTARYFNCNPSTIWKVCNGKRKDYKGMVFSYKDCAK